MSEYTKEELAMFKKLIQLCGSQHQMDRIAGRLDMARFIREIGEEKTALMFKDIEKKGKK